MKSFLRFYLRSFLICITLFAVAFVALKYSVRANYQGIYKRDGQWVLPNGAGPVDRLLVDLFAG